MIRAAFAFGLVLATAAPAAAQDVYLLLHGNWCGFQNRGGPEGLPPIDALDAACMRHDRCYDSGTDWCDCDLNLMGEVRSTDWTGSDLGDTARAIYDTIALKPCGDRIGQRRKAEMAIIDWQADIAAGRTTAWDVLKRARALFSDTEYPENLETPWSRLRDLVPPRD